MTLRALASNLRQRSGPRDEAGAVLIIWVIALVAILGMSAMAVDLGNIAQTKEHGETAVQDAALAAVRELVGIYPGSPSIASSSTFVSTQVQAAVTDAETYITDNYSSAAQFSNCPANVLAGATGDPIYIPTTTDNEQCIGFFDPLDPSSATDNASYPAGIAVALPTQTVSYTVGRAAGLSSQSVSALAYASVFTVGSQTAGVPFGYPVTGPAGLQCLKNTSTGACTGFSTGPGQFGTILSPRFTIVPGFTNGTGSASGYMQEDLALGLDHSFTLYNTGDTPVCDGEKGNPSSSACNGNYNYPPGTANYSMNQANLANFNSGMTSGILTPALFTGVTPYSSQGCPANSTIPPRLAQGDSFAPATGCTSADVNVGGTPWPSKLTLNSADSFGSGYSLNGVPIAHYLLDSPGSSPPPTQSDLAAVYSYCDATAPGGSISGSQDTYPIDYPNGTGLGWASFDTCLSSLMETNFTSDKPPATFSPVCTPQALSSTPPINCAPTNAQPIFSADIVDSTRFGFVPLVSTSGTGTNAAPVLSWAGAYLDLGFESNGNGKVVGALQAWVFPLSLIEGSPNPGGTGYKLPYSGGPWGVSLCSLSSSTC